MQVATPSQSIVSDLNVMPLIDVLLVLIVIFLMLQKVRRVAEVELPPPVEGYSSGRQILLEIGQDGSLNLNGQPIPLDRFQATVAAAFAGSPTKPLFVKSHPSRPYQDVIRAIDLAKLAGVRLFAMVPRSLGPER